MSSISPPVDAAALIAQRRSRATPARVHVLDVLLGSEAALSHHEVERLTRQQALSFDRVTLYRALEWLVNEGLAHRVSGPGRSCLYNAQTQLPAHHAHFHCQGCEQIYCLDQLQPALFIDLPEGYQLQEAELNLRGHCPDCASNPA